MAKAEDKTKRMEKSGAALPVWRPGDQLTAARLSRHIKVTNSLAGAVPAPSQIVRDNVVSGTTIKMFWYFQMSADYLWCREYVDGVFEFATTTFVAKPWELRRSPFDKHWFPTPTPRNDVTYTYTGDQDRIAEKDGESDETQTIVMRYRYKDIIVAAMPMGGGTGIKTGSGKDVEWQDLNVGGRMWAAVL